MSIRLLVGQSNYNLSDRNACIAVENLLHEALLDI